MPAFKVALGQITPVEAEKGPLPLEDMHKRGPFPSIDANLAKAAECIKKAVDEGASVIMFPENGFQGLIMAKQQYATLPGSHIVDELASLAKQYKIDIVTSIVHGTLPASAKGKDTPASSPFNFVSGGSSEVTEGQKAWADYLDAYPPSEEEVTKPDLVNTAIYIDGETGKVLGRYNKQNLWHPEREFISPGERKWPVFDTRFGRAGMLICWDLSHPGASQSISDQEADLIYVPTYWGVQDSHPIVLKHNQDLQYERQAVHSLCYARSFETETALILCNSGGPDEKVFMGGSGVWVPLLGNVGTLGHGEEFGVMDVNTDVLKDAREVYKIREDWTNKYGAPSCPSSSS